MRELGREASLGEAHDAALLGLMLRMTRARTFCYEVGYVIASNLDRVIVANLSGALWTTNRELDARIAEAIARVVVEGRWDLSELTA